MKSLFRPFPLPLSGRQWFYLGFLQGLGAGFIDGGANFGIAYAMYSKQEVVKMWVFKQNTIAGDLGVTPIIQCLASMIITSSLVHTDLHSNAIKPLPFCYPHVEHLPDPRLLFMRKSDLKRKTSSSTLDGTVVTADPEKVATEDPWAGREGTFAYYYWMLIRFIFEGTEKNMMFAKPGVRNWFGRLLWTAAQGAAIGIVFGFPLWCLAIVILGPIYGTGNVGGKWAPQAIKGIYGAIVGWVTNPVIAVLALGSQAEHHLLVVEHDPEQADPDAAAVTEGAAGEEQAGGQDRIATIREGEELEPPTMRSRAPSSTPSRRSMRPPPSPTVSMGRVRAHSNASVISGAPSFTGRPPLTANVSYLSPLPTTPLPAEERPVRPRGATVSSSTSVRSYSYVLGGTGGRAQRSRSNTVQSATMPKFEITTPGEDESAAPASAPGGSWDAFGRNEGLASPVINTSRSSPGSARSSIVSRSPQVSRRISLGRDADQRKED